MGKNRCGVRKALRRADNKQLTSQTPPGHVLQTCVVVLIPWVPGVDSVGGGLRHTVQTDRQAGRHTDVCKFSWTCVPYFSFIFSFCIRGLLCAV